MRKQSRVVTGQHSTISTREPS